ncbi:MAG: urea ABC transporter permease subunit UrtB [Betaproteobacteria bacterium]|nr:urea ABC transporter permease subunit UrtB [Betaproteobacteria bacterium]
MKPSAHVIGSVLIVAVAALLALAAGPARALTADAARELALGDSDARLKALGVVVGANDTTALPLLQGLVDGEIQVGPGERLLRVTGDQAIDVLNGAVVAPLPEPREDVIVNNRLRREFASAIAVLRLTAPERELRLAAAKGLQSGADEEMLPAIIKALTNEQDSEIRGLLAYARATVELGSTDKAKRVAAIQALGGSHSASTKTLLLGLLEKKGDAYAEPDADVRAEVEIALRAIEGRLATGEMAGRAFSGLSLGSILLLAALGLAITYGLMGVINMAHGELMMIGAYATYVVQNAFRSHVPAAFDYYLVAALPVAFLAAALVGMVMERTVIRFLYGRPLETLLATWGISLILMQATRMIFGAQNVQVENPVWMSGGITVFSNAVLPYSRIVIIGFAAAVLTGVWLLLTRTRLGLFVRGVTQNRPMASALGVPTGRIDTLAFGLGSGIAGLAGCALSQIGNVGPDLGQSYIVDSFMVVVLGGVGQLAGTVYAGLGLGIANKFLEAWSGAVLAKIAVLVFIIVFIQKRPQGLLALKGRMADG